MIHTDTLSTQLVVLLIWGPVELFPFSRLNQTDHFCAHKWLFRVQKGFIKVTEVPMDIERNPTIHYAYSTLRIQKRWYQCQKKRFTIILPSQMALIYVIIIIIEVICKHLPCSRGWPPFPRKVDSGMGFGFMLSFGPADGAHHVVVLRFPCRFVVLLLACCCRATCMFAWAFRSINTRVFPLSFTQPYHLLHPPTRPLWGQSLLLLLWQGCGDISVPQFVVNTGHLEISVFRHSL